MMVTTLNTVEMTAKVARMDDDGQIIRTITETVTREETLDVRFLIRQHADIVAQKEQQMAERDAELADVLDRLQAAADAGSEEAAIFLATGEAPVEEISPVIDEATFAGVPTK